MSKVREDINEFAHSMIQKQAELAMTRVYDSTPQLIALFRSYMQSRLEKEVDWHLQLEKRLRVHETSNFDKEKKMVATQVENLKIKSSFDWNITECVDYMFENEYSFANVMRSIFGEVDDETDEEEGLMLRYRDMLKAKKEQRMLNEIERLCHESGHFILRAKSPIYKQIIMKKDNVEVLIYDFIVERAIPFAIWLERRSKEFAEKVKDGSKPKWWKFTKANVKQISRGVIRALWILSLGFRSIFHFLSKLFTSSF
ncbi:hypothetical protein OROGR_025230 [Orobanche gracilis]